MRLVALTIVAVLFSFPLFSGCRPSQNDFGKVVSEVPEIPESEGRYKLPEAPPPTAESKEEAAHSHADHATEKHEAPPHRPALSAPTP